MFAGKKRRKYVGYVCFWFIFLRNKSLDRDFIYKLKESRQKQTNFHESFPLCLQKPTAKPGKKILNGNKFKFARDLTIKL